MFARYSPLNYTVTLKLHGVRGHSRSSKVALFDRAYNFIFVFYSNYTSIYYRFRDIAEYWSKIATALYILFGATVRHEAVRVTQ